MSTPAAPNRVVNPRRASTPDVTATPQTTQIAAQEIGNVAATTNTTAAINDTLAPGNAGIGNVLVRPSATNAVAAAKYIQSPTAGHVTGKPK
ncbi:hypothetical protein [Phytohabitans kaempferiae]|uniref:Uncharacterized protein n=1 Tax=Phytohabitans kaempferiae TaxID=1620943 RepID=A0ABV6M9K3_9ACTN